MKQTIRIRTFETNSSSYHSLSIHKKGANMHKMKEFVVGENVEIDSHIEVRTIGYTESYSRVSFNNYDKAKMLLRIIAGAISNMWYDLPEHEQLKNLTWQNPDYKKFGIEIVENLPIMRAFKNAVKRFTQADVTIKYDSSSEPFMEHIFDDNDYPHQTLGIKKEDMDNEEILTERFYEIIFNDEYEIVEECESNE